MANRDGQQGGPRGGQRSGGGRGRPHGRRPDTPGGARERDRRPASTAPVIDDEVFGYRKVNVEVQRTDPGSLLNKMREIIRIRKAHSALSRGDLRVVEASNRAVLAYVRTQRDEVILAVNNLESSRQTVELPLEEFSGAQPVDLFTGHAHPLISDRPFHLELERYGYCWLQLENRPPIPS